jgi:hypothetical protein
MEWDYFVDDIEPNATGDDIEAVLTDAGLGGWELVTSVTLPGDPHVNDGAARTYLLFKQPIKK